MLESVVSDVAVSDSLEPATLEATTPPPPACAANATGIDELDHLAVIPLSCAAAPPIPEDLADARAYLIETAKPGYTMTRQGPELAIGRLHPEFAVRLASALREAREAGLTSAGIFSAYRPPAFGVGGFRDKFNSLHTYGLAVDMHGIGSAGSAEAQRWHEIAAKHRGRLPLRRLQPRRMESLPAHQAQDDHGREPVARDGRRCGPARSREHVRSRHSRDRKPSERHRNGDRRDACAHGQPAGQPGRKGQQIEAADDGEWQNFTGMRASRQGTAGWRAARATSTASGPLPGDR